MLKIYFKLAFRNLRKHLVYTFINIFGLAVGMTGCGLISLYVFDELSYDKYHENAENIYRMVLDIDIADTKINGPITPAPMGVTLVADYPEVIQATRVTVGSDAAVRLGNNRFNENRFYYADSTFFEVFGTILVQGDPKTALTQPNTVVLTEETAIKYFGSDNPMNKILIVNQDSEFKVTGIVRQPPQNTHFHFDFLASLASSGDSQNSLWVSNNFYTYVLLQEGSTAAEFEEKLTDLVDKYVGPQLEEFVGIPLSDLFAGGGKYSYTTQKLTDIHLYSHMDYEMEVNGDINYVYIFAVVALFLLLIACINFMNLATGRSTARAKEVGIKKVMGSNKGQLIWQFLVESVMLCSISAFFAVLLFLLGLPYFNDLIGKQIQFGELINVTSVAVFVSFVLAVGFFAGSYPAFFLASFRPIAVLQGKLKVGLKGGLMRKGLVSFQFTLSIFLIISTLVVGDQLDLMQNIDLGFNKKNVLVVHQAEDLGDQFEPFRQELAKNSNIEYTANSNSLPGGLFSSTAFVPDGAPPEDTRPLWYMLGDYEIVETMQLEILEGRTFSKEFSTDTSAILINEATLRLFNWDTIEDKQLSMLGLTPDGSQTFTVIGLLKDFNFQNLRQNVRPFAIVTRSVFSQPSPYLLVRFTGDDVAEVIATVEEAWKRLAPGQIFEYSLLEDDFNSLFQSEMQLGKVFSIFTFLALFVACLGLFGLSSFTAEQRTKEIGVRKVLGATIVNIVVLQSKEFSKLILLSFFIALPISYLALNRWLQDFAFRVNVGIDTMIIAGLLTIIVASLTISYQAIKAALAQPVKSLRYE